MKTLQPKDLGIDFCGEEPGKHLFEVAHIYLVLLVGKRSQSVPQPHQNSHSRVTWNLSQKHLLGPPQTYQMRSSGGEVQQSSFIGFSPQLQHSSEDSLLKHFSSSSSLISQIGNLGHSLSFCGDLLNLSHLFISRFTSCHKVLWLLQLECLSCLMGHSHQGPSPRFPSGNSG